MSEYISDSLDRLAPNQRGYGKSYALECVEDYKTEFLVQSLKRIIEHFGGSVPVLGHDYGAAAAKLHGSNRAKRGRDNY